MHPAMKCHAVTYRGVALKELTVNNKNIDLVP